MTKKMIAAFAVAVIMIATGVILLLTSIHDDMPHDSDGANTTVTHKIEYEPATGYYNGRIILGGKKTVHVKYRRLKKPIDITANFKCTPSLTTSPLQSVLTNTYMQINRQPDFLNCHSNPESIHDLLTKYYNGSLEKYFNSSANVFIGGRYLGEIIYKDTTFVIFQFQNERNIPSFTRIPIIKTGDKFLIQSGGTDDAVIMNLSADNYSLVTGMSNDIPASKPTTAPADQQEQPDGQCDPFVVLKPGYAVMIPDPADKGAHFAPLKHESSTKK